LEQGGADDVATLDGLKLLGRRKCSVSRLDVPIRHGFHWLAEQPAEVVRDPVPRDPHEPVLEPASVRVKIVESFQRRQPHLLMDVLGNDTITANQVENEAENLVNVAIVNRRPGGPFAARQRPLKAAFVLHGV
jgi:hypothetical protein